MAAGDRIIEFEATTTAHLRCPIFGAEFQDEQLWWNALWAARLEVFGRIFPWLRSEIRGLAQSDSPLDWLDTKERYRSGTRSGCDKVRAIHERQNAKWKELTGIGPLGTVHEWRTAAAAAGVPPADFDSQTFPRLADLISAWAAARIANMTVATLEEKDLRAYLGITLGDREATRNWSDEPYSSVEFGKKEKSWDLFKLLCDAGAKGIHRRELEDLVGGSLDHHKATLLDLIAPLKLNIRLDNGIWTLLPFGIDSP